MGLIILFAAIAIIVAFLSGIAVAGVGSPDNDNATFTSVIAIFFLVVSISISIGMTYIYVENKEYSSTKYNLKEIYQKIYMSMIQNLLEMMNFTSGLSRILSDVRYLTLIWFSFLPMLMRN